MSVNNFRPSIFDNHAAVWEHGSRIEPSAAFRSEMIASTSLLCRKMSINGASTILDLACCIVSGQCNAANPQSTYRQPLLATMPLTIWCRPCTIEPPPGINTFCWGSARYIAMNCIVVFLNWVLRSQCSQYVLVYNVANRVSMSHRSDFFGCTSWVNIEEHTFYYAIT